MAKALLILLRSSIPVPPNSFGLVTVFHATRWLGFPSPIVLHKNRFIIPSNFFATPFGISKRDRK
ncbi:hypothetical protein Syun_021972 [Stephania yunnanensis]|uniref:Uncharacterized protein n=1 Tax=Stephania yunnanensis TaxID=152371 RepID=A0AAP0IH23_9MAGN